MTFPKALLKILNLSDDADEAAVVEAATKLKKSAQVGSEVEAILELKGGEAIGAVRALKETKAQNDELAEDLEKVKVGISRRDFEAVRAKGVADKKLTPAEAKHYSELFEKDVEAGNDGSGIVAQLNGWLKVASRRASAASVQQIQSSDGSALDGPMKHDGKAFEDMRPIDRHNLKQANPELYDALRSDAEARKAI